MEKVRRVERMVALTKLLVDSPQELISLRYFCDFFDIAKSTLSEDLSSVKTALQHFSLGSLETVAGGSRRCPFYSISPRGTGYVRSSRSTAALTRTGPDHSGRFLVYVGYFI